jgi:hyaluronan synthase
MPPRASTVHGVYIDSHQTAGGDGPFLGSDTFSAFDGAGGHLHRSRDNDEQVAARHASPSPARKLVYHHGARFVSFGVIGGDLFLAGLAFRTLLTSGFHLTPLFSNVVGAVVSVEVSFLLNRWFTWPERDTALWSSFWRCNAQRAVTVTANLLLYVWLLRLGVNYLAADLLLITVFGIINYIGSDRFVFAPGDAIARRSAAASPGEHPAVPTQRASSRRLPTASAADPQRAPAPMAAPRPLPTGSVVVPWQYDGNRTPGRQRDNREIGEVLDIPPGEKSVNPPAEHGARRAHMTTTATLTAVPEQISKPQERIPIEHSRGGSSQRAGGDLCHDVVGDSHPARLAPWQKSLGGAIPRAQLAETRIASLFAVFLLGVVFWAFRQFTDIAHGGESLAVEWSFLSLTILAAATLSWTEQPKRIIARDQARLDELLVTVNVPVYNEDPAALRLVIHSLLGQTRLPDRIQFVDDGSDRYGYAQVQTELYQAAAFCPGVEVSWVRTERTPDSGKRAAQAVTFSNDHRADVFVTIDSDTVLDARAIEEGLKPFADPRVVSVAAVLLVYNVSSNLLTRFTEIWLCVYQLGIRAAWSQLGRVLINSGGLAFYRASVVREALPAYLTQAFFGRPVRYSDDSMLTFFSLLNGRTVQQPSCFAFTVMPEKVSHHIRQQLRWMRGSTVQSFWWFRYLPMFGLAWWLVFLAWVCLTLTTALWTWLFIVAPLMEWRHPTLPSLFFLLFVGYIVSLRCLMIKRSDQTFLLRLVAFAGIPVIGAWGMTVLRSLQLYSFATCLEASWGTRQKVEVTLLRDGPP